jgi:two-component system, sensor histidine kinase LadS
MRSTAPLLALLSPGAVHACRVICVLCLLAGLSPRISAAPVSAESPSADAVSAASQDPILLGPRYRMLEDPAGNLDLAAVMASADFAPLGLGEDPNLGYSQSAWWFKTALDAGSGGRRLLELPFPTLDEVRVYLVARDTGEVIVAYAVGDRKPFAERPYRNRHFVFPLDVPADVPVDLYLRVKTEGSTTVGSLLWMPEPFVLASRDGYLAMGLYFGILGALFAYNGLLYLSLRDTVYLWYVLFVSSMALGQGAWNGLFFEYLWPNWPAWGNLAAVVGFDLTGMFGALFSRAFLASRVYAPWIDRAMLVCAGVFAALAFGAPWWPYQFHAVATSLAGIVFPVVAVVAGVRGLQLGQRSARFFLMAWSLLLAGTALLAARNLGWVPTNFLTLHGMQIASALEMLLLSFALAERITELRREKEAAEDEALRVRREMVATLGRRQQELDQHVEERTRELTRLNAELHSQRRSLEALAHHDPLTGLANRNLLDAHLVAAIDRARTGQHRLALLLVDLDAFKPINDTYGHAIGDRLLKLIARRLEHCVRAGDVVTRFGGDEFVVLLEGFRDPADVLLTGQHIVAAISRPVAIGDLQIQVGASIGVAFFPGDGETPMALLQRADEAMYEAKRAGRGRVRLAEGIDMAPLPSVS